MLRDVMTAAAGVADRIDVALVTGDARAQALAREFGFLVIEDERNESESAAIEMATTWCEAARLRHDHRRSGGHSADGERTNCIACWMRLQRKVRCSFPPTTGAAAIAFCGGRRR